MPDLTFGENFYCPQKLDLYRYQMAERLGVHPNSITNYERGEGKPHASVQRMFDLLCEREGVRFDDYEAASAAANKGDVMKIVLQRKYRRQPWRFLRPSRDGKF